MCYGYSSSTTRIPYQPKPPLSPEIAALNALSNGAVAAYAAGYPSMIYQSNAYGAPYNALHMQQLQQVCMHAYFYRV
jgi:hypothetical protein